MSSLWQATIYYIGQEVDRRYRFNLYEIILESILPLQFPNREGQHIGISY